MATDHETRNRALKATRLITQLRLDMAAIAGEKDPDVGNMFYQAYALTLSQWQALAARAGVNDASEETRDMVLGMLTAMLDIEERYSAITPATSYLR